MRIRISLFLLLFWSLGCLAAPLPQDEAFRFKITPFDANTVQLDWSIKKGYFLYQKRISAQNAQQTYLNLGQMTYPDPQIKLSKQGEQILIYRHKLRLFLPVLAHLNGEFLVQIQYQGCSDEGFCYPPQTKKVILTFDKDRALSQITPETALDTKPKSQVTTLPQNTQVKSLFSTSNPLWIMLSFFGFGVLIAFTPCVLPMVPVLSSIIVGHGPTISTRKAFLLSLSYVVSMSVTYGVIGAIIAKLGANLQVLMQSPWVIGSFSLIFVILALSMFDMYQFRLPLAWQERIANITRSNEGGHYLNAALMGSMSILILSPCVTPPLIGALTYIAEAGSVMLGSFALFFLGLGMGTPLLLIGTSAGKLLPKTGLWMNTIKYIFGMVLLGLAIHLLSRLLPPFISMMLWSVLFIVSGVGLKPFVMPTSGRTFLLQAIGIMLIIYGGFVFYGASVGHTDPWHPLSAAASKLDSPMVQYDKIVTNVSDAQQALLTAKEAKKPVVLDFYASWCDSCQHLEKTILHSKQLQALQDKVMLIQIDLSKNDEQTREVLKYFNVIAPPTFLFYDETGHPMPELQWVGMLSIDDLVLRIEELVRKTTLQK
ncbi:MAG: thiol:disulfide interchange protein [Legionella sp.]|nr:MAG: thiol:disulfide interchange protein [Legionella sp.]